jgi:hypothetical protein
MYELRLCFAETVFGETGVGGFGGESTRCFDVLVNGQTVIHALDVVGEAGASTANIRVLKDISPALDGMLHLSFLPLSYVPFLNAIEITRGVPGRLQNIRMVAQAHGYIDKMGNLWEPDHRHGTGGQLVRASQRNDGRARPRYLLRGALRESDLHDCSHTGPLRAKAALIRAMADYSQRQTVRHPL